MDELIKELVGQGVTGVFAAIFIYMFWTFLKKYITNTEEQTKVLAVNSKILEQNSKVMEQNTKIMGRIESLLDKHEVGN